MSMGVATARSQLCLKRLLDEPQDILPKCKRICLAPPPSTTGPSPCLRPRSPSPKSKQGQSQFRVGPYLLFERCEGEETYKAVHAHTQQQYTCQVTYIAKNTANTVDSTKILQTMEIILLIAAKYKCNSSLLILEILQKVLLLLVMLLVVVLPLLILQQIHTSLHHNPPPWFS